MGSKRIWVRFLTIVPVRAGDGVPGVFAPVVSRSGISLVSTLRNVDGGIPSFRSHQLHSRRWYVVYWDICLVNRITLDTALSSISLTAGLVMLPSPSMKVSTWGSSTRGWWRTSPPSDSRL